MKKYLTVYASAVVGVLSVAGAAYAEFLNIDFSAGTNPAPLPTYAAAGLAGTWNNLTSTATTPQALFGLDGLPVAATLTLPAACAIFDLANAAPNGVATPAGSDAERLLDDVLDCSPGNDVVTINGLTPGSYTVILYGVAPDSASDQTLFSVGAGNPPVDPVVGQLPNPFNGAPGDYVVGLTHRSYNVNIAAGGALVMNIGTGTGTPGNFQSVNGIQIAPEPATLALLAIGAIGLLRRRR